MSATNTTSLRKAAIVLGSLPPEVAADLVARLEPRLVAAVLAGHACSTVINEAQQRATLCEFVDLNRTKSATTARVPAGAPAKSRRASLVPPFQFLHGVDARTLATILADEHPQTIAFVAWHLAPERGAQLVARLRDQQGSAVTARIAAMGQPRPDIARDVADVLAARMLGLADQRRSA